MKRRLLLKRFEAKGWHFERRCGCHDIWSNGFHIEQIPRHREINERLAKALIEKWKL